MRSSVLGLLVLSSCRGASPPDSTVPATNQPATRWADVRREIEASICVETVEMPQGGTMNAPSYGDRDVCGLPPPEGAVARAVALAYEDAQPVMLSLSEERRAAAGIVHRGGDIDAVRKAYLTPTFLGLLLPPLYRAFEAEGIVCDDCPEPTSPPRRDVQWDALAPYLIAHVWADPVVTPQGGKPTLSVHICSGVNGVSELADPDPTLVRAAYLAAFHTDVVRERVGAFIEGVYVDARFGSLTSDEARTAWLREQIRALLLADTEVRSSVCDTLDRFVSATGVVVTDCR